MIKLVQILGVLKARLSENSTWVLIGAGATAASALPSPWSYISLAVAIVGAMIPNKEGKET